MARWDEIFSLPVQNPSTLEFSSSELVWSKVEGWRDNIDRLALIPFARVDDFVRGESSNKECPTRFHVEARRRRPPTMSCKAKVDGILEYILYWCSFGPDDHRQGGIVRPSRNTYIPKKKNAGRPNTKRGCTCHFIVKRLIAEPSVALIIYNQDKHVDKKGSPCHGPQDEKSAGTRAMFAPYISEDLRLRVLSLLHVGVAVETIMQRHNESVERQGGPSNRDDLLTHRYVRIQERSIRRSTHELDEDDAVSVSMWVESHQSNVFYFEDFSDSEAFTIGIQTEWQLQQMIRFGNCSLLASDSRFGSNKLKYPIHSLIVFNTENKAIPVAWVITPRFASGDASKWMRALYNRVRSKDPTWKLAGFIVDDPVVDTSSVRDVFQCSVLLSFWRVRHAWHKNLLKRCKETEMCIEISRRLGDAVDDICRWRGTDTSFEDFIEDFVDASDFMDYFKAVWYPRIGAWTSALQALPLASQETCAALEFYHLQLKRRLLNEKDSGVYQRCDWLVNKLGTKVHSYFWLDEYSGKDDFARYWKDEWVSGVTSWRKALKIPDSDVIFDGKCAKVTDQLDRDKTYIVRNPGSQFGICACSWAEKGYLCEHVFKVIEFCRERGSAMQSASLFQFNRALIDMLHCPPRDSLIRDHAVALAVFVEKKLKALLDMQGIQAEDTPREETLEITEQQTADVVPVVQDTELFLENQPMDEDVSFPNENGCAKEHEASGCIGKGTGKEIFGVEMEVDPSLICISPPGLLSVSEAISSDVIREEALSPSNVCGNLPSEDSTSIVQKEPEECISAKDCDQNMRDKDSLSVEISTTLKSLKRCTTDTPNGDDISTFQKESEECIPAKDCDEPTTDPDSSCVEVSPTLKSLKRCTMSTQNGDDTSIVRKEPGEWIPSKDCNENTRDPGSSCIEVSPTLTSLKQCNTSAPSGDGISIVQKEPEECNSAKHCDGNMKYTDSLSVEVSRTFKSLKRCTTSTPNGDDTSIIQKEPKEDISSKHYDGNMKDADSLSVEVSRTFKSLKQRTTSTLNGDDTFMVQKEPKEDISAKHYHANMTALDSLSAEISPTLKSFKRCTTSTPNGDRSNETERLLISNTEDATKPSRETSPSTSVPVNSRVIDTPETSEKKLT